MHEWKIEIEISSAEETHFFPLSLCFCADGTALCEVIAFWTYRKLSQISIRFFFFS